MVLFLHVLSQNKIIFTGLCDNLAINVEELKEEEEGAREHVKDGHYTYILIFQN